MDTRTLIRTLKQRIKDLAEMQRDCKLARKTKYLPESREKELRAKWPSSFAAWADVFERRAEITACLNYYLELRGREYRHGIRDSLAYEYQQYMSALRKELVQA